MQCDEYNGQLNLIRITLLIGAKFAFENFFNLKMKSSKAHDLFG